MIKIHKEDIFFNAVRTEDSFSPDRHALIFVYRGAIELEANSVSSTYKTQNVIVISPNSVYKLKSFTDDLKVFVLSINRQALHTKINFNFSLSELYQIVNMERRGIIVSVEQKEFTNLIDLSQQLYDYLNTEEQIAFKNEIIMSLLSVIIYITANSLIESKNSKVKNGNSRKEEIMLQFFRLANIHFKEEKELKFYADALSISVKYLSICVKEITNTAPSVFLADLLVNESKILLLNTSDTISMIADKVGFSDQYAFGKFFKKHTGLSPKNYRKENNLISIS